MTSFIDKFHMIFDDGTHIGIGVTDGDRHDTASPFFVQLPANFFHFPFLGSKFFSVMLAQKVLHFAVLAAAFDGRQMVKPFIPFSINRLLFFRQQGLELTTHSGRIDHLILGTSRMDAHALDGDSCRSRVEVFIFQFTQGSAVNSISNLGTKFFKIEELRTFPDFLIRRKTNADLSVFRSIRTKQTLRKGHDFSHTGFIISPQKCRSICHNEPFSLDFIETGKSAWRHDNILFLVKDDIAPLIIYKGRMDWPATYSIARIKMADEANGRTLITGRGDGPHDIAIFILDYIRKTHGFHFFRDLGS